MIGRADDRKKLFMAGNKIILAAAVCVGLAWAIHPFLNPPQGLFPAGWSTAQLIQNRYPFHLINPARVGDIIRWSLAETAARLGVVVVDVICVFILLKFKRRRNLLDT